jgi:Molybdate transporter of MFS superfamily
VIGVITVAGLAPAGVLFGFGAFLITTGLFYGLPIPVQPVKAVSAVILTDGLRPGEIAAAGMILGIILLVLGSTGWIGVSHGQFPNPSAPVSSSASDSLWEFLGAS